MKKNIKFSARISEKAHHNLIHFIDGEDTVSSKINRLLEQLDKNILFIDEQLIDDFKVYLGIKNILDNYRDHTASLLQDVEQEKEKERMRKRVESHDNTGKWHHAQDLSEQYRQY
tara:strand:- start:9987 stop:10331 length:345 start_codon:yes stop_codon:yes gene_type:complete